MLQYHLIILPEVLLYIVLNNVEKNYGYEPFPSEYDP